MIKKGLNVLSLFDGMSCGRQALERAGIKVNNYYASEIDKYAMRVTMENYPDTKQLGSVTRVDGYSLPKIDLMIGGSPCQSFSFAGKRKGMATTDNVEILSLEHYLELKEQNFEFEGQSYLFWEYMRILEELRVINPNIKFLLENVLMGEKWQKILTQAIGINPIQINSALVSAQNRQRLYWTNIGAEPFGFFGDLKCMIPQPQDRGILLKDVLESDVDAKYFLSEKAVLRATENDRSRLTNVDNKCGAILSNQAKQSTDMITVVHNTMPRSSKTGKGGTGHLTRTDGKTYCLDTGSTNAVEILNKRQTANFKSGDEKANSFLSTSWKGSQANGMTLVDAREITCIGGLQKNATTYINKSTPMVAAMGMGGGHVPLVNPNSNIRRLTPTECERLQTVKSNEIKYIITLCGDQVQNYVSAVEKNHKLLKLALSAGKTELSEFAKLVTKNTYQNHQQTKYIAHQNAGTRTRKETLKCISHNQVETSTIANNAVSNVINRHLREMDSAEVIAFISITEGKITQYGKEELRQKDNLYINQANGKMPLNLFGKEIMEYVIDAGQETQKNKGLISISTTLSALNTKDIEQILITLYLFAKNAINGYTPGETNQKNLSVQFNIINGYTNHVSDSQRYKMLGNGWTVSVIAHILKHINQKL